MNITEVCAQAKVGQIYQCTKALPGGHVYTVGRRYEILPHFMFGCVLTNNFHSEGNLNYCQDGMTAEFKRVKK